MTTAAFDGFVLAADRQLSYGSTRLLGSKISRAGRYWYAEAGNGCDIELIREWLAVGASREERPVIDSESTSHGMAIDARTGAIYIIEGKPPALVRVLSPHCAVGSGGDFAMAAMELGCDAVAAVRVAAKLDVFTGAEVDSIVVRKRPGVSKAKRR